MNAFGFFNFFISTFSLPLITNCYFDSYGPCTYKYILSISGRRYFIKFSNALVLLDPEPPVIKILPEWSGI